MVELNGVPCLAAVVFVVGVPRARHVDDDDDIELVLLLGLKALRSCDISRISSPILVC